MSRSAARVVLLASVAGLLLAAAAPPRVAAQAGTMPLADMHFHALDGVSPQDALREMDRAGVRWAGSGARGFDDVWRPYLDAAPDRFIPFVGQGQLAILVRNQGEAAWTLATPPINKYLMFLERSLKGSFRGIGEIIVNNKDTAHPRFPGTQFPVDSPLMQHLFKLAGTYRVPLSFHAQADPPTLQEMDRLLAQDPSVVVIWCHAGSNASARQVEQLMDKYPNFYADLATRDDRRRVAWVKTESITGEGRRLRPEWKALLEKHSSRFFIGTDMLDDLSQYQAIIGFFRDVLTQLPPEAARRIGYENAQRLFNLKP